MAELFLSDGSEFSKIPLLTETITTDTNLDNHSKTGYYVVRGAPSTGGNASSPSNRWASVFTDADIGSAMNFNNLENSVGRLSDLMQTQFMQTSQGLASVGYENLRNFASTQDAIKDGNYALSSQLANCCCENKQATADLKYSAAMNTASINENTTAQTQKILDALAQDKIESLQAQVSELKTQNMFCGVPRISPYGYGVVPNFATPCGCGCNGATF